MRRENYSGNSNNGRRNSSSYNEPGRGQRHYSDQYIYQRDYEDYDDRLNNHSYRAGGGDHYGDYNYGGYNDRRPGRNEDRNFFERAGDRIRDTWNDLTDHDNHSRYAPAHDHNAYSRSRNNSYGRDHNRGGGSYNSGQVRRNNDHYRDDDRNFFERAGDRIRDTWDDWRHEHRSGDHGNSYRNPGYPGNSNYNNSNRNNNYSRGSSDRTRGFDDNYRFDRNSRGSHSNDDTRGNHPQDRPDRGHHDYNYSRSGTSRFNSDDYYNGMSRGGNSGIRRSRLMDRDYSY